MRFLHTSSSQSSEPVMVEEVESTRSEVCSRSGDYLSQSRSRHHSHYIGRTIEVNHTT